MRREGKRGKGMGRWHQTVMPEELRRPDVLYKLPDHDAPVAEWCKPISATMMNTRSTDHYVRVRED